MASSSSDTASTAEDVRLEPRARGLWSGLSTFWVRHETGETPEGILIRVQQVAIVARRTPVILAATAANAILTATAVGPQSSPLVAAIWAALVVIGCALGYARWRVRRKRSMPAHISNRGPRRLAVSATLQGLVWGVGCALIFPEQGAAQQMLLGMVVAGMSGAAAMILSNLPAAAIGYTVGCVLPLVVRLALVGEWTYTSIAIMGLIYIVVLLTAARSFYVSFIDSIRSRVANDRLLADLSSARLDLLDAIASSTEGFALFDSEGRMVLANDRFAEFLDIDPKAVRPGRDFGELLTDGVNGPHARDWVNVHVRRSRQSGEMVIDRLPGGRWAGITHRRTTRGGMVTTAIDLTRFKENEAQLVRAKVEADVANRAKSEFLAMMSHELRTPLNAIMGFSEIFMKEMFGPHSDPRYVDYAKDIFDGGQHLLNVINDILDISKIEAGRFDLNEEAVDVGQIAGAVKHLLRTRSDERRISVTIDVEPGLPLVLADARAVRQMITNLLSNSLKFTDPGGSVVVSLRTEHDDSVLIEVADTGIGIDPEDIPLVLEPFGQADRSLSRREGGTGLGLPLVKSLIELHGGSLQIVSAPREGTSVFLRFPASRTLHD
ncbi:MAG: ATP-binding protein [Pseudomonadota bacterium]|nr:ATP-binding protein [Pseudomonadota bacterium]